MGGENCVTIKLRKRKQICSDGWFELKISCGSFFKMWNNQGGGKIIMSVSRAKFEQKGDTFVAKKVDNKKKKKLKKVEDKILGWGLVEDKFMQARTMV
ncbi:uncharacterized protein LOC111490241 isoform X2 [Cucurbita maxima]|uniref:Uncharacterized protein LOC111490241 isoform X2 n=1 Tax=Cucurbita maxima TaxID=3661 RepID=A0A6J1JZI3_CUCMA|nr:uncharacterized protein LOC111490241 isoform X2 [Cucurbita maxima]